MFEYDNSGKPPKGRDTMSYGVPQEMTPMTNEDVGVPGAARKPVKAVEPMGPAGAPKSGAGDPSELLQVLLGRMGGGGGGYPPNMPQPPMGGMLKPIYNEDPRIYGMPSLDVPMLKSKMGDNTGVAGPMNDGQLGYILRGGVRRPPISLEEAGPMGGGRPFGFGSGIGSVLSGMMGAKRRF